VVGIEAHLEAKTHGRNLSGTSPTTNEENGQSGKGNKDREKRFEKVRSGGWTC